MTHARRLPPGRLLLLIEATGMLSLSWLMVRTLPFRLWSFRLGTPLEGDLEVVNGKAVSGVRDICRAVTIIDSASGSRFTCLMRAMAAHWMLDRRNIASCLVLGTRMNKEPDAPPSMQAHAWLKVGSKVVLGQHDGGYIPVSSFVRSRFATDAVDG